MDFGGLIMEVDPQPREYKKGLARIKAAFCLNWKEAVKHPIKAIKDIIILYLDEDSYYCWADLVAWAEDLSGYGFWEFLRNRYDFKATGCGYCGKCEK